MEAMKFIDSDTLVMLGAISVVMYRLIDIIKKYIGMPETVLFIIASGFTFWYTSSIGDLSIQTLALVFLALTEAPRGIYNITKEKNEYRVSEMD